MPTSAHPADNQPAHGRSEVDAADDQSVDDAFRALLEGLRTTLPGVEVMVAFLLILPLQSAFDATSTFQRTVYLIALMSSALAVVFLIAPSAHQRVRAARTRDDEEGSGVPRRHEHHLQVAVNMSLAGTVLAAIAIIAAVGLAGSFVLGGTGFLLGAVIGLAAAWTWFWVPAVRFDD